jgi:hypothetical protein
MSKFTFLTGDVNWKQYGGKFISPRQNNGDWNYYLIISVTNMWDATGDEEQDKYDVEIQAVSPEAAKDKLDSAFSSAGFSDEQLKQYQNDPIVQAEVLSEHGIYARLWGASGNNINELMKQARKESELINGLFGFYMDKPENGIGQDGWQLIRGQDVRESFGG